MRLSELTEQKLTDDMVGRLLFGGLEYGEEQADVIAVLGSRKAAEYRVPQAVRLYFSGKAPMLMLCGGKSQQTRYGFMPEYRSMLTAADELGIPRGHIITEERSQTTEENLLFGAELLAEKLPDCRCVILVTTAYHMRRSLLLAEKLLPQYEFIPAPSDMGSTRRDTWRLTEKGRRTAREECMKLGWYAKNEKIENIEI